MKGNYFTLLAVIGLLGAFIWSNAGSASPYDVPPGSKGISFVAPSWKATLEKAKQENKLIFIDAYASWCGTCKRLKKSTLSDAAAGEYFNSHFINVAIDMEKGDGPSLAVLYQVNAYPTLLVVDSSGTLIASTKGYLSPDALITFGKTALAKTGN